MNIEDIKIGEIYNVRVQVKKIGTNYIECIPLLKSGVLSKFWPSAFCVDDASAFSPFSPYQPLEICHTTKIPEAYPKYDPYRKFREGDIVEPSEINGRLPEELLGCYRYKVITGEGGMTNPFFVKVKPLLAANYKHLSDIHVNAVFLKLVTPVEEQEPYYAKESHYKDEWQVWRRDAHNIDKLMSTYACSHPHAKEAAEAERDRLNAEYRKELANG